MKLSGLALSRMIKKGIILLKRNRKIEERLHV